MTDSGKTNICIFTQDETLFTSFQIKNLLTECLPLTYLSSKLLRCPEEGGGDVTWY